MIAENPWLDSNGVQIKKDILRKYSASIMKYLKFSVLLPQSEVSNFTVSTQSNLPIKTSKPYRAQYTREMVACHLYQGCG